MNDDSNPPEDNGPATVRRSTPVPNLHTVQARVDALLDFVERAEDETECITHRAELLVRLRDLGYWVERLRNAIDVRARDELTSLRFAEPRRPCEPAPEDEDGLGLDEAFSDLPDTGT